MTISEVGKVVEGFYDGGCWILRKFCPEREEHAQSELQSLKLLKINHTGVRERSRRVKRNVGQA